jgi:hypothetical protein
VAPFVAPSGLESNSEQNDIGGGYLDSRLKKIRHPTYNVQERPFIVIWEVTRACDLAYAHCRAEAMPRPDPPVPLDDGGRLDQHHHLQTTRP